MWTFYGHAQPTLDAKGRVTVPARWRHEGMEVMVALLDDVEPALRLMPEAVLYGVLSKLEVDAAQTPEAKAKMTRLYSYEAIPCPLDKQGRLLLPSEYIEKLGLSGVVQLVGAFRHFEIWRLEVWQEYFSKLRSAHSAGALRINH